MKICLALKLNDVAYCIGQTSSLYNHGWRYFHVVWSFVSSKMAYMLPHVHNWKKTQNRFDHLWPVISNENCQYFLFPAALSLPWLLSLLPNGMPIVSQGFNATRILYSICCLLQFCIFCCFTLEGKWYFSGKGCTFSIPVGKGCTFLFFVSDVNLVPLKYPMVGHIHDSPPTRWCCSWKWFLSRIKYLEVIYFDLKKAVCCL